MGKTYKEMKNAPKWERVKKRDFEDEQESYEGESYAKDRSPKPERKHPRGYR